MPAAMTQKPPQQRAGSTAGAPLGGAQKRDESKKKGFRQRLHDLPQAAGIALMALLLVLSLFVGNATALRRATPQAFLRQGDVKSIVEDRVAAAGNALTVARRASLEEDYFTAVETAMAQLSGAQTAREISRANQVLTAAVSEMTAAASGSLNGENQQMLTRAVDNFTEQGSFLRQEARSYNEKALKAESVYEGLPTKGLLSPPDVYEGI